MAEHKAEATQYECDARKCDVVHVVVGDEKPKGRRLTSEGPDGEPVKAYACKATHIRPAIEAAEEKAAADAKAETDEAAEDGDTAHVEGLRMADADDEALEELEGHPLAVGQ